MVLEYKLLWGRESETSVTRNLGEDSQLASYWKDNLHHVS